MPEPDVIQTQLDLLRALPAATQQRAQAETEAANRQQAARQAADICLQAAHTAGREAPPRLAEVNLTALWRSAPPPSAPGAAAADPEKALTASAAAATAHARRLDAAVNALQAWRAARARACRVALTAAVLCTLALLPVIGYAAFSIYKNLLHQQAQSALAAQDWAAAEADLVRLNSLDRDYPGMAELWQQYYLGIYPNSRSRPKDGMIMVWAPPGEFQMGSENGDREKPVHTVALTGYWIDRTEVTNVQYQWCVAAGTCAASIIADDSSDSELRCIGRLATVTPASITADDSRYNRLRCLGRWATVTPAPSIADDNRYNGATQSVVGVSWYDAVAYCEWAGGRLPTEAEWEYAARGPEGQEYPWGDASPTCDLANYVGCVGATAPVGSFPAGSSWVGASDMAGNVWEWVADWYGPYLSGRQVNPTGPTSGSSRVLRGGSFHGDWGDVRAANRYSFNPDSRGNSIGFRCAAGAPGQ